MKAMNAPFRLQFLGEAGPASLRLTEKLRLGSVIAIAPFVLRSRRLVRKRTLVVQERSGKVLLTGFALGFRKEADSKTESRCIKLRR